MSKIAERDVQLYADAMTELVQKYQVRLVFSVGMQPYPYAPVTPEWGYQTSPAVGIVFTSPGALAARRRRLGL